MSNHTTARQGLAARLQALNILHGVISGRQLFDHQTSESEVQLEPRDRAFVHALVAMCLRHGGEIDFLLKKFLTKPLPHSAGNLRLILKLGAAQLLFMDTPAHAAIDLSVELAKQDKNARHFAGLANAVLRRVANEGKEILATVADQHLNTPPWLWRELAKAYGEETAHAITLAHLDEAALDITVKADAADWATKLDAMHLPTGSLRLANRGSAVPDLAGFGEGKWWVQDAATALPVKCLGELVDKSVLDLCAAPGGKTAQLASAGAVVTAVDLSPERLQRLAENLTRLDLAAEVVVADVLDLPETTTYDIVVLDAPCSATGTLRRHPDLVYLKSSQSIGELVELQWKMLHKAATLVKPGGILLYCTCSLLPSEGEKQVTQFLKKQPDFETVPLSSTDVGGETQFINREGWLRTHPAMAIGTSSGLDGFFAAKLRRRAPLSIH